jgi:hypothetical protein
MFIWRRYNWGLAFWLHAAYHANDYRRTSPDDRKILDRCGRVSAGVREMPLSQFLGAMKDLQC